MGYYVRLLPRKKTPPTWKIQFITYKKPRRRAWDVRKARWRSLGFHSSRDISEAKVRSRQLNAQLMVKLQEEKIRELQKAENDFRTRSDVTLPTEFVDEFELCFINWYTCRRHPAENGLVSNCRLHLNYLVFPLLPIFGGNFT